MSQHRKSNHERLQHLEHDAEGAGAGAVAGAVVGAVAGPVGIIAGAIAGGIAGGLAAAAMQVEAANEDERTRELDAAIGVSGGEMGAEVLKHPPAVRGAYSAASAGGAAETSTPAEGPLQTPGS